MAFKGVESAQIVAGVFGILPRLQVSHAFGGGIKNADLAFCIVLVCVDRRIVFTYGFVVPVKGIGNPVDFPGGKGVVILF